MKIERVTSHDFRDVLPLLEAQFVEHDIDMKGEALERVVRGMIEVEGRGIILAGREEGRTLGVAVLAHTWSLEMGGLTTWLDELYVIPEKRNGGFGTELLRAAIEIAGREGLKGVDLEVEHDHVRVEGLYLREGFERRTRNRFVRRLAT